MEQKESQGIAINLNMIFIAGVILGIVLIIIGAGVGDYGNEGVFLAGLAITTISLFGGGFLMKGENNVVRLGLFLAGAIILAFLISTGAGLGLLGSYR
jgi:hypothetical protein